MSKSDARNALLVGSYIATSRLGSASFVPELVAPGLSPLDIQEAAQELISDGLVTLPDQSIVDVTVEIDPFRCPYEITPKGKDVLQRLGRGLRQKAEFGLIKIIVATGGSTVHNYENKTQVSSVVMFEQNMIKHIESAKVSDKDKQTAKSKLKEFLAHPLLSTVLGSVLGAALKS